MPEESKMPAIAIVNTHHGTKEGEYIGRGSPLGNPYSHLPSTAAQYQVRTREDAIRAYRTWLDQKIQEKDPHIIQELNRLGHKLQQDGSVKLRCFCAPKACHGDVIKETLLKAIMNRKPLIYAGIGSRQTPADVLEKMKFIATELAKSGWILRSGHADGADMAFETGAQAVQGKQEIFLPWWGFNNAPKRNVDPRFIVPIIHLETYNAVATYHPNWEACTMAARKLHCRNANQIFGKELDTPTDMVVCWTPGGEKKGGTAMAITIAERYDIPVFNLAREGSIEALCAFVEEKEACA